MINLKQVWIIQCKSTGHFLTTELGFCTSFKGAGRLYDYDEALDTALVNLEQDYELHTFFQITHEPIFRQQVRHYG